MAAYEVLLLNTAIPQIQAAQSGDTYVVPRDIQITANLDVTGNTTLGDASTDTVLVNGYMGVGGAPGASTAITVAPTALTGTLQYGVSSQPTGTSAATNSIIAFDAFAQVANAVFTVNNVYGLSVRAGSKGASATATNWHGIQIADQTQGTNNYGITSLVSSGTNKWNIYASGTAANYFAGNVGIGTSSLATKLTVQGAQGTEGAMGILSQMLSTTAYNASPIAGISLGTTYNAGGSIAGMGGIAVGKENATDGNYAGYLALYTRPNGGSTTERLRIDSSGALIAKPAAGTGAVFNEDGVDADFRVESDTNTHALFVDAGNSRVGINNSAPNQALTVSDSASTPVAFARTSNTVGQATYIALQANNASNNAVTYASAGSVIDVNTAGAHSGSFSINTVLSAAITERVRVKSTGQVRFVPLAADPAGAEAGDVYYNSGTNKLRLYDGTSWVDLN